MNASGSMTGIELMTALGRIYGFEIRDRAEQGAIVPPEIEVAELITQEEGADDLDATESAPYPNPITKGVTMAKEREKCKNGCGKNAATPDGTCYRCYRKEHGESYNAVQKRKAAGGAL